MSLSRRQESIIEFIRRFAVEHQFPPTIREIGEAVGISSTSVVNYNLNALEKKGLIERDKNVSRGLRLVDTDENVVVSLSAVVQVPLLGRIAAGEPIPIPDETTDFAAFGDDAVEIAAGMLKSTEGVYALEVRGDSMIDALINDGDIVVMRHQADAQNGDMVAARLLDSGETTLKRFFRRGDRIQLRPENPTMQPIDQPAANVSVQGKVMMVIRRLD